mgnify:CR=1 FL=1
MEIKYSQIPFNKSLIEQKKLDIENSRKKNALPWRGQFSPNLVESLLGKYAIDDGVILDPFCGSGTTLAEASIHGNTSYGVELNPAAYILARLYTFCGKEINSLESLLIHLEVMLSLNPDITCDAQSLANWIKKNNSGFEKIIMEAIFLLTLGNGEELKQEKLNKAFTLIRQIMQNLHNARAEAHVMLGDARQTSLDENSIDLVLTSPPYVNVFNYHQNYRKAVEFLGWQVLPTARAEFGSNRKNRSNRLRTVIQYAQDIGAALVETQRVVKTTGKSIWVVGRESKVRGCSIPNPEIIYRMATEGANLTLETKMERSFTSRYGQVVYEDILVFSHKTSTPPTIDIDELGRKVGVDILMRLSSEDESVNLDIQDAINFAPQISSSPISSHIYPDN